MTKIKFNIGDIVITLVDKVEHAGSRETKCPKGTQGTVCSVGDGYVTLDISGTTDNYDTFDYANDDVQLIKSAL